MNLGLQSVTLQITILFIAVLAVSQLVSLGYRYFAQTGALPALEAVRIADRIATSVALMETSTAEQRSQFVELSSGSNLVVAWTEKPSLNAQVAADEKCRLLQNLLMMAVPTAAANDVRVGYTSADDGSQQHAALSQKWSHLRSRPAPLGDVVDEFVTDPTFLISLPLSDGTWLNLTAAYADTLDFWPVEDMALLGLMVIFVAVLAVWAIHRLTAPFRLFTQAARRLGTDVYAPPIAEQGPAEVVGAIRSFNEMQCRIQRYLSDRTLMVAAISHDLRTPITRLRLRAEFIEDSSQRSKALTDLSEMEQMIDGVLTFAKEDMPVEPTVRVDLVAMLESICDDMTDRGFLVSFETQDHPIIHCRPGSMRRCFTNLINNAIRYGGRADVGIEIGTTDVLVHVDDGGPGIPDEAHEHVFRPFFRLDPSRNRDCGGVGLGLGVARDVARAHGGDVVLANRVGFGLRCTVRIPVQVPTACS